MMQNRRVIIFVGVMLLINLILAIVFRDFIRENVLVPILYLFWYIRLFLRSLGEVCLWPLSLLVLVVISLIIIQKKKKVEQMDRGYTETSGQVEDGQLTFWMKYIRRQSTGVENLSFTSFRMRELVLSVLAYQENLTNDDLEAEIEQGRITIPKEMRKFVQSAEQVVKPAAKSASLINKIIQWLQSRSKISQRVENPEMENLVRYLEAQLEIEHDDGNNESSIPL